MKDVKILYHPDDIHQHFHKLWKTDLFKTEHNKKGSFINKIMERAARYPMFVYSASDHPATGLKANYKTEYRHFSPWWGGIHYYPIEQKGLHDSCWLHELHHKGYMVYLPNLSFAVFCQKMIRSEVYATIASMFEVYFRYPEFRGETFDVEILVDRFMVDNDFMNLWNKDKFTAREQIYCLLREASLQPNPADILEQQVYIYGRQNQIWANIWSSNYNEVETQMAILQASIRAGVDRKQAMDDFMGWLRSEKITQGTEIPFIEEANAFAAIYKQTTSWL